MKTVSAWVAGMAVTMVGGVLGGLTGGWIAAAVVGVVSLLFAIPFGRGVSLGQPYVGAAGVGLLLVDITWSALNTWAGAIYYGINKLRRNPLDEARSRSSGSLWLVNGVFSGFATTIGTVKAGSNGHIDAHEELHVLQARLFGPLYLPLVGLNYVVATIIPYWLLFRDKARYPINGFATYFLHGVYPHVWNERWAYRRDERLAAATAAAAAGATTP